MGETLVEFMLECNSWHVERLGIEHLLSIESRPVKDSIGGRVVRAMPDFVAYVEESGGLRVMLVEVKTRTQPPTSQELERYGQFDGVLIVWVSPLGMKAAWVINKDGRLVIPQGSNFKPIEDVPSLFLDRANMPMFHRMAARLHDRQANPKASF